VPPGSVREIVGQDADADADARSEDDDVEVVAWPGVLQERPPLSGAALRDEVHRSPLLRSPRVLQPRRSFDGSLRTAVTVFQHASPRSNGSPRRPGEQATPTASCSALCKAPTSRSSSDTRSNLDRVLRKPFGCASTAHGHRPDRGRFCRRCDWADTSSARRDRRR
jgi:hypothetical protein